jgi:hypothetical protein
VTLPYPSTTQVYASADKLRPDGGPCSNCFQPKKLHIWTCAGCGDPLAWGDEVPTLHTYRDHFLLRHSSTVFLRCPPKVRRKSPPKPKKKPNPTMALADAVKLLGTGERDEVKKRYLEIVTKHHPDKHPQQQREATEIVARANVAWGILREHHGWA